MNSEEHKIDQHPDTDLLSDYIDAPSAEEFRSVRRHLMRCVGCQKEVASLQQMLDALQIPTLRTADHDAQGHPDEFLLADYVERQLPEDELQKIKRHLHECADCAQAALHYSVSSEALKKEMNALEVPNGTKLTGEVSSSQSYFLDKLNSLFSWRMPGWVGLPVMTAAAAIIIFLFLSGEKQNIQLLSYQDRPEIVFQLARASSPGIGFMGNDAGKRIEAFQGMSLVLKERNIIVMNWPEVEAAQFYQVKIYLVDDSGRSLVAETEHLRKRDAELSLYPLKSGTRYEWELSGKTDKGDDFITAGGFVVGIR